MFWYFMQIYSLHEISNLGYQEKNWKILPVCRLLNRSESVKKSDCSTADMERLAIFVLARAFRGGLRFISLRKHAYSNIYKISFPKIETFQIK